MVVVPTLCAGGIVGAAEKAKTSSAQALARTELLLNSSYPRGWQGQGSGSSSTQASTFAGFDTTTLAQLTQCMGIATTNISTHPAEAAAQEWGDNNSNAAMTDTVDVFPTAASAAVDVEAWGSPKTPTCLEQQFGSSLSGVLNGWLGRGAVFGRGVAAEQSIPNYGDHTSDLTFSAPVSLYGLSGTDYLDVVEVQKGRSESILMFDNTGTRVSTRIIDQLTRTAAARMTGQVST